MEMILDFICRLTFPEMLMLGLCVVYVIAFLPVAAEEVLRRWENFKRLDREEYQPWMNREKWNETGENDYYMRPHAYDGRKRISYKSRRGN